MAETTALLLDEHVPRILETTLAANGYETVRADDRFGERTVDAELLDWCRERGYVVLSNDRRFIRLTDDRGHGGDRPVYRSRLGADRTERGRGTRRSRRRGVRFGRTLGPRDLARCVARRPVRNDRGPGTQLLSRLRPLRLPRGLPPARHPAAGPAARVTSGPGELKTAPRRPPTPGRTQNSAATTADAVSFRASARSSIRSAKSASRKIPVTWASTNAASASRSQAKTTSSAVRTR